MIGYEGAPRYASLLMALTGDAEIVPPGLTLESDRPEYSLYKRERLWSVNSSFAALAANFNQLLIGVPVGSQYITVIEALLSTVAANAQIQPSAFTPAAGSFVRLRDGRAGIGKLGATRCFTRQNPGALADAGAILLPAGVWVALDVSFITASQTAAGATIGQLLVESTVVNVAQTVYALGYERVARVEELADV